MTSKRDKPATPNRGGTDAEKDEIRSPPKKTVFTGEKAMDQDVTWPKPGEQTPAEAAAAEERRKRLAEREAKKIALRDKIAKQKETGRKEKKDKTPKESDGDDASPSEKNQKEFEKHLSLSNHD